jgi:predicted PurR-regulated permease PerM
MIVLVAIVLRSQKLWSIIAVMAGLILMLGFVIGVVYYISLHETISPAQQVKSFIETMNPELDTKIQRLNEELGVANTKIKQLEDLKRAFPKQTQMINQKISLWQSLREQLTQVSNEIDQQVEKAYVLYKINEIQGKKKFTVISENLIKDANVALDNAEVTKSTIEKQLYE